MRSRERDCPSAQQRAIARRQPENTMRIGASQTIPAVLRSLGFDPAEVLSEVGVDHKVFDDADNRISFATHGRLVARCVAVTGCKHFGVLVGQRSGLNSLGLVGLLVRSSPNVETALQNFVRNLYLHLQGAVLALTVDADKATLRFDNVNDVVEANSLLHGEETDAFGDAGYQGVAKRPDACEDVQWHVGMRLGKRRALDKTRKVDALIDQLERLKASIRAKVEHPFPVVKRQFGHVKVRYRGLKKNTAQLTTLFALSNLWMARRALLVLDRGASPLAESGHPGRTGWSAACADAASAPIISRRHTDPSSGVSTESWDLHYLLNAESSEE
jgi:hypothetical protein